MSAGEPQAGRNRVGIDNTDLRCSGSSRVGHNGAELTDARLMEAQLGDVNASRPGVAKASLGRAQSGHVALAGATTDRAGLRGLSIIRADVTDMTLAGIRVSDPTALWNATHGSDG